MIERGAGGRASLCLWELCEGNLEGGLACSEPGRVVRKDSEMHIYFHWDPTGEPGKGSSTRDFERWLKRALGIGHFSLKRLSAEGLWEGLLYWGPWKAC